MAAGALAVGLTAAGTTGTMGVLTVCELPCTPLPVEGATTFAGTAIVDGLGAVAEDCSILVVTDAFDGLLAATTIAPVAVTGVNPGKLLGSG